MTESTKNENVGQLQLIAGMAMSGTIGLFVVWSGQNPFNVGFWRCLIGGLCLLLFCFAKGYLKLSHVSRLQWVLLAVSGVVLVLNWAALFASYLHAGIGVGTVIYNTQPFFLLLAGPLIFGERITLKQVLLAMLAFGGVILIVLPALLGVEVDLLFLQGAGFALLAAMLYSGVTIVTKKLAGIKPHVVAMCQLGVGLVFLAPIMAFDQMPQTSMQWLYVVVMGVFHTFLMYILIYSAYQSLPVGKIAILSYVYPVVAVIADYFAFGHEVGGWQWLGIVMIIAAGLANARNSGRRVQSPDMLQKNLQAGHGELAGDAVINSPVRTQSQ
ncbi:hypothetical protein TKWG_04160 [Advenella kashmirensis WT001]|uniref:EamA domain-containing protein n=1 Tax=Advenella kashmirensis (strain DSM 17095 / LMG 22695 / WT001) TaxID=1036672 RepID=I3U8Q0_ADVKW|nr:DMT family transporter [Advenella kashmirensis]AFK61388.1 hypothetical protein TKWG_04160 [Advenella kashmirensis WT001]